MWEVMARRQPFAGRNFMGVSTDVLEGRRPPVPAYCPPAFKRLLALCWHAEPAMRPAMEDVLLRLEAIIDESAPGAVATDRLPV
jgi:hypothetical protein